MQSGGGNRKEEEFHYLVIHEFVTQLHFVYMIIKSANENKPYTTAVYGKQCSLITIQVCLIMLKASGYCYIVCFSAASIYDCGVFYIMFSLSL